MMLMLSLLQAGQQKTWSFTDIVCRFVVFFKNNFLSFQLHSTTNYHFNSVAHTTGNTQTKEMEH